MSLARIFGTSIGQLFGRRVAARSAPTRRPSQGATICCSKFRLTVPAGFNDELWQWMASQGWQPLADRDSRYRYRALPSNVVAALVDAPEEQRERLLALGLRRALDQQAAQPSTAGAA